MGEIQQLVDRMDPEEAISEIAAVVKRLFQLLGEKARIDFVASIIDESGGDKVGSMVQL
jgi:hypothetical protein